MFVVAVVILHGYLALGVLAPAGHVDDFRVQLVLVAVYILYEFAYSALIEHDVLLLLAGALIIRGYLQPGVQKGLLAHSGVQRVVVENGLLEHLRVRVEAHDGAGVVRFAYYGHRLGYLAAGELHLINLPVFVHAYLQPVAERVHNARAHAVQAAGDLVSPAAELAAGVQYGVHDLKSRLAGLALYVHGDAAAVVRHADNVPRLYGDFYVIAISGEGFVDRVVDDLVDKVVQPGSRGGADVHAGAEADRLEPLEHLYLAGVVFLCYFLIDIGHALNILFLSAFLCVSAAAARRGRAGRGKPF